MLLRKLQQIDIALFLQLRKSYWHKITQPTFMTYADLQLRFSVPSPTLDQMGSNVIKT